MNLETYQEDLLYSVSILMVLFLNTISTIITLCPDIIDLKLHFYSVWGRFPSWGFNFMRSDQYCCSENVS